LDVFLTINYKMCVILDSDKFITTSHTSLKLIDSDNLEHCDFICTCFVYNVNIVDRKLILLSEAVSRIKPLSTLLRCSCFDKTIDFDKNSRIDNLISSQNDEDFYYTRNKFMLSMSKDN
jgi:hypothetical protein